jgi:hypothetical protein
MALMRLVHERAHEDGLTFIHNITSPEIMSAGTSPPVPPITLRRLDSSSIGRSTRSTPGCPRNAA